MAGDIVLGITLTADGSDLVGAVRVSGDELEKLEDGLGDVGKAADRADKKTDRFAKGMKAAGKVVAVAAGLITAATVGLVALSTAAIANADAIGKQADKIGIGVESLQELRYVSELAGVAQNTLDMSMQRFSRRVGEARQGMGELLPVLQQYGIALIDADGRTRSLEDVLADYADAVAGAKDGSEQLRLAFKGFDSEGAALVNLLRQGSEGMERLRQEARNTGVILSESMVRQAEATNDSLTRMKRIVSVNFQKLLVSLAPTIENLAVAFSRAGPFISRVADAIAKFVGGVELLSLEGLEREMDKLHAEYRAWKKTLGDTTKLSKEERAEIAKRAQAYLDESNKLNALWLQRKEEIKLRKQLFNLPPLQDDSAEAARQKERDAALDMLDELREANMAATDQEVALIEYRKERQLEAIAEARLSQEEALEARVLAEQNAALQIREITKTEQERLEESVAQHLDRIQAREAFAAEMNRQLWDSSWKGRLTVTQGVLGQLSTLMETGSKKMFAIGKAAAIGETIIQTYRAAQGAYAALASIPIIGPALGIAAAAAAIASGLARVQAIKSQQFGGSGSVSRGARGGGRAPAPSPPSIAPAPPVQQPPERERPRRIAYFTIEGEIFTRDWMVDKLLPLWNDLAADGAEIRVAR